MTIKIGINGMGRIGRMVIRAIIESNNKDISIKHINNRSNLETTCSLLKYDSIHGKLNTNINLNKNNLIINKNKISFSQESNLENIEINLLKVSTHQEVWNYILKHIQKMRV